MSLALLARPALRQQTLVRARAFHASRPARSTHDDYHHLPFAWPTNKTVWAAKVTTYLVLGFSIPFIASGYQLHKSAGGSD
ncbi:hypothetical protein HYPSUDRAFT_196268 [Hypholoma sublateritium FD-334 SS-4]|uniref:Cytochrome c oxidase subunit 8, mitochondrial n=1 Tax=Hypholoma sublateritium (strain FD-334 SS-4) TaxID=945553 RepID=A0A0D2LPC3_HYPSF|nr:hypothetical protein HYPSUDRAFT_196268 [Hypholoma sublateritium FD-334 SS-4]